MPDMERRLKTAFAEQLIGQPDAIDTIVPRILMHQAGMAPEGRPLGVYLLLGPTGTGKTHTVETLAQVLHGTRKHLLRINCGEFGQDHEVAKLIGAPPGYLGHRETHPILTQPALGAITSSHSPISIILLDEIEKAAPAFTRILLGVLDRAEIRLGDNSRVDFTNCLIFMTSNLGARGIQDRLRGRFGMPGVPVQELSASQMNSITCEAARRHFPPEFINRIDAQVIYNSLTMADARIILDRMVDEMQELLYKRLKTFKVRVNDAAMDAILEEGFSQVYGARNLRRALQNRVFEPLANLIVSGGTQNAEYVDFSYKRGHYSLAAINFEEREDEIATAA